jgi:hypothetical protein
MRRGGSSKKEVFCFHPTTFGAPFHSWILSTNDSFVDAVHGVTTCHDGRTTMLTEPPSNNNGSSPAAAAATATSAVSLRSLLDANAPWLIVPNGSYKGYFDWVPLSHRVGPWSPWATIVLAVLYAMAAHQLVHWTGWQQTDLHSLQYPVYGSAGWIYNVIGGTWMVGICAALIFRSPLGLYAWITYTVQSWSLLTVRHILCALAPWSPTALLWAERIRFPCAVSPTITFVVWNFVLMPYAYFVAMQGDAKKQRHFLKFCTSFRLLNLHGLNIVLCALNVGHLGSPPRTLERADLLVALLSVLLYFTFYLCILDRLGVHLYSVFSPRTPFLLLTWPGAILCYLGTFHIWSFLIAP